MKKKSKKKSGGKGKRRATKSQLLGLAKAQAKLGNAAAATKLRARANAMGGGTAKGKGKGRSKNPAKTRAAAPAAAPKKKAKRRPKVTKTETVTTRTVNPSKGKGGRSKPIGISLTTTGKGNKKQVRATIGNLRRHSATKGYRYLDLSTGQLKKAAQVKGRTSNPSVGTGGLVAIGAGVVIGAPIAEALYRFAATRPGAFGDTKREAGWVGANAMMRINHASPSCSLFVGGLGVLVGGGGFALLGSMPILGGLLFGVGAAHVGVAAIRGFLSVVGKTGDKIVTGEEDTFANRIAPEFTDKMQADYKAAIEAINAAATAPDAAGNGGTVDGLGSVEATRRRIQEARQRQADRTPAASPREPRNVDGLRKAALAGLPADPPAVAGCNGSCKAGETCGPDCCNHKASPAVNGTPAPAPKAAPPALPPANPVRVPAPSPARAPVAFGPWGNLSKYPNRYAA